MFEKSPGKKGPVAPGKFFRRPWIPVHFSLWQTACIHDALVTAIFDWDLYERKALCANLHKASLQRSAAVVQKLFVRLKLQFLFSYHAFSSQGRVGAKERGVGADAEG